MDKIAYAAGLEDGMEKAAIIDFLKKTTKEKALAKRKGMSPNELMAHISEKGLARRAKAGVRSSHKQVRKAKFWRSMASS